MHETTAPPGAAAPVFYETEDHAHEGPTLIGFWLSLMCDSLIFAVLFAWIFLVRGFGIAVGTHVAYDVMVGCLGWRF